MENFENGDNFEGLKIKEMATSFGEWSAGDAVIHEGRNAHIIPVDANFAKQQIHGSALAPIMLDDESGGFVLVKQIELRNRF